MKSVSFSAINWFLIICLIMVAMIGIPQVVKAGTPGNDAVFTIGDLTISPAEAGPGQSITISATITETNNISGIYESILKINDTVEESKPLSVGPLAIKEITFTVSRDGAGVYSVNLDGLTGSFKITEGAVNGGSSDSSFPTAAIIGVIVAAVVVVGLLALFLKKKKA